MSREMLQKYRSKVLKEAILKSALCGLTIGSGVLAVLATLYWAFGWKSVWVCPLVGVVVAVACSYLFYRFKYCITVKNIARRVDELGLEERVLTMLELENDDSFIAQMQRKDTQNAISKVKPELIKVLVSGVLIAVSAVAFAFGAGGTTVAGLAAAGVIPSGKELLESGSASEIVTTYEVIYEVREGNGKIQGEAKQTVVEGEDAKGVAAVADDGWVFVCWVDGKKDAYRVEENVTSNIKMYAVFELLAPIDDGKLNGDEPQDVPGDETADNSNSNNSDQVGDEVAGKFEEVNQIYNGQTYYGSVYDEAYKEMIDTLYGEEYSDDEKKIGSGYFDNIEKTEEQEQEE